MLHSQSCDRKPPPSVPGQCSSRAAYSICQHVFALTLTLEALEYLKGSQVVVLGGDVLQINSGAQPNSFYSGKPKPTYYSWHADRRPGEDLMDYIERSIAEAERYIRSYPDPEDGTILYCPVISELGV
jgi:hypothetical protein